MVIHDLGLRDAAVKAELLAAMEPDQTSGSSDRGRRGATRVAVIEGRALFRELLISGLQAEVPSVLFVGYHSIAEWISVQDVSDAHIAVISMESLALDKDRNEIVRQLGSLKSTTRPIHFILASSSEDPDVVLPLITSGASAYVSTSMSLRAIAQVLHLVEAGGVFVPFSVLQASMERGGREPAQDTQEDSLLSPRQMLVAKALRKGTPNKIIAYDLNMCESTVKVHVRQIMKKLKARNRTQVAFLTNAMFGDDD